MINTPLVQSIITLGEDQVDHVLSQFRLMTDHHYDLDEIIRAYLDFLENKDIVRTDVSFNVFAMSRQGDQIKAYMSDPYTRNTAEQFLLFERALVYLYNQMLMLFMSHYRSTIPGTPFRHTRFIADKQRIHFHNAPAGVFY